MARCTVRTLVPTALFAFALWLAGCTGVQARVPPADVIIVLGSGLEDDGSAGTALQRRTRRAAEAFRIGLADRVMCTGGRTGSAPRTEADACREILVSEGVPPDVIIVEDASRTTGENAVYARALMDAQGLRSAILVTDRLHMLRASLIFSELGIPHAQLPVSRRPFNPSAYSAALRREITALQWYFIRRALGLSPVAHPFG